MISAAEAAENLASWLVQPEAIHRGWCLWPKPHMSTWLPATRAHAHARFIPRISRARSSSPHTPRSDPPERELAADASSHGVSLSDNSSGSFNSTPPRTESKQAAVSSELWNSSYSYSRVGILPSTLNRRAGHFHPIFYTLLQPNPS